MSHAPTHATILAPPSSIAVVSNPRSRRNRYAPHLAEDIGRLLATRGHLVATHSRSEVLETAAKFRNEDVSVVALNGGDGTIHFTLTAFLEVYQDHPLPAILLLRGGTMNTIAWDLGQKSGSPVGILRRYLDLAQKGETSHSTRRHLLKVTRADGSIQYGFIFGNGLLANFLKAYYDGGDPSMVTAAKLLLRAIFSVIAGGSFSKQLFQHVLATVEIQDRGNRRTWPHQEWDAIAAATVGHIGLGFYPFYRAITDAGHLEILGLHGGPLRTLWQLPRFFRRLPANDPKILTAVTDYVQIRAANPFAYTIDGDIHESSSVRLEIGPELTFLLP